MRKKIFKSQNSFIFGVSAILAIGFVVFAMNSCNKEMEQIVPENQGIVKQDATTRVKVFKEMMKSQKEGNLELRSTMTAEELIYNIEANMNYTYAEAGLKYDDYAVKTDTISVPELGGPMLPNVVTRVNDEVLDSIECFFEEVVFNDKKLKLVDVFPVSGQNAIGVTTVVGSINNNWLGANGSFGPGDDWKANSGKCDGSSQYSSAPEKIASYATWNVGVTSISVGTWFDDIEIVKYSEDPDWFALNPNDNIPGNYILDYYMWQIDYCLDTECENGELPYYIEDPDDVGWIINPAFIDAYCIDYPEMNYYLAHAEAEAQKFEPILSKTFLHMSMWHDGVINYNHYKWYGKGWYAKKHVDHTGLTEDLGPCK